MRVPRHVLGVASTSCSRSSWRAAAQATTTTTTTGPDHDPAAASAAGLRLRHHGRDRWEPRSRAHSRTGQHLARRRRAAGAIRRRHVSRTRSPSHPNGERAYVANYTSNSVTPIDLVSGKVLASIPLGASAGPGRHRHRARRQDGLRHRRRRDRNARRHHHSDRYRHRPDPAAHHGRTGTAGHRDHTQRTGRPTSPTPERSSRARPARSARPSRRSTWRRARRCAPITVGNAPIRHRHHARTVSTALVTNLNSGSVSPIDIANDTVGAPIAVKGGPIAVAISSLQPTIAYVVDAISNQSQDGERDADQPRGRHRGNARSSSARTRRPSLSAPMARRPGSSASAPTRSCRSTPRRTAPARRSACREGRPRRRRDTAFSDCGHHHNRAVQRHDCSVHHTTTAPSSTTTG